MYFDKELPNGATYTFSSEIFPEYQEFLDAAQEENHPEVLNREGVAFYCIGRDTQGNRCTWQMKDTNLKDHYGRGVYELGGVYSLPSERRQTPLRVVVEIWQGAMEVMQGFPINAKLLFITRTYVKSSWDVFLSKGLNFKQADGYYLTSQPTNLQRSWKKVKYLGNINLLNVPQIEQRQYNLRFGKYFFKDDLIPELNSLRENPGRCLIIGDKDNQATVRLLDKFGLHNSFEIDQLKTDQKDWRYSKAYYTQSIEKVKLYNLRLCKHNNKLKYIDTPDKKYNLIYIDLPEYDYKHLLEQDGLYIDRREYKA